MNYQSIPNRWLLLYVNPQNTLVGNILYCLNLVNKMHVLAFSKKKKTKIKLSGKKIKQAEKGNLKRPNEGTAKRYPF